MLVRADVISLVLDLAETSAAKPMQLQADLGVWKEASSSQARRGEGGGSGCDLQKRTRRRKRSGGRHQVRAQTAGSGFVRMRGGLTSTPSSVATVKMSDSFPTPI